MSRTLTHNSVHTTQYTQIQQDSIRCAYNMKYFYIKTNYTNLGSNGKTLQRKTKTTIPERSLAAGNVNKAL